MTLNRELHSAFSAESNLGILFEFFKSVLLAGA